MTRVLLLVALVAALFVGGARLAFSQDGVPVPDGGSSAVLWEERTIKSAGPATFDNRTHTEWVIHDSYDRKRGCEDARDALILIYKHQPPPAPIEGYKQTRRVGPDRVVDVLYDTQTSVYRESQSRYLCLPVTLDPRPRR